MGKQIIIYKQANQDESPVKSPSSSSRLSSDLSRSVSNGDLEIMSENSDEDQFVCRYCEKVLYSARSLQIHEDKHTETLKYRCIYCDKTFPSQNSLSRHERAHTGQSDYECNLCEDSFPERISLVNHITKMHPVNCDLSQSVSVTTGKGATYLVNMESIKPSQTKPVNNPTQIRNLTSSKSENYVSTTTRNEGSKEARFQCGYCDKSFATPSKVKRHILTHTGEKPFVCQFCQRGFSQKVHMMEHISKHHADESLKAQQEAAASAAAQAAAAAAAAPAPLIRTLPNNKTVYTSQNITAVPVICSSGQTQAMADSTAMQAAVTQAAAPALLIR